MLPNNLDLILVSIGVSDGSLLYLNHLCDVKLVTSLIGVAPIKNSKSSMRCGMIKLLSLSINHISKSSMRCGIPRTLKN